MPDSNLHLNGNPGILLGCHAYGLQAKAVYAPRPGPLVNPDTMDWIPDTPEQPRRPDGQGLPPERPSPEPTHLPPQEGVDYDLMQRIASNSEAAVAELYDRFGSLVYRMALQSMPSRSEAEDAVQEIFVRLWRTADRYDPSKAALVTWVMLLTRRQLVDKLRRKRSRIRPAGLDDVQVADAMDANAISERIERDEHFAALMLRIDILPDLQRTVIIRAYLGGQTLRQISEEMDIPLGTIKSALSRALVRLRERTGEEASL
jgi:RNA polymerase sigma-70 factor, ECF subfamily